MDIDIFLKIIEEQLPFPSGTATAQLINVLHQLPPPDTGIRRRRGYQQVDTEADNEEIEDTEVLAAPQQQEHDEAERDEVEQEGWHSLVWSFVFSAAVSVRTFNSRSVLHLF